MAPFVVAAGIEAFTAGDAVVIFSSLTASGAATALELCGRAPFNVGTCDVDRGNPLTAGEGRTSVCRPLMPALTICLCRAKASLSTETVFGVGDGRCGCDKLSVTLGFGPPSFSFGPAGPSTFDFASSRSDLKCSCFKLAMCSISHQD